MPAASLFPGRHGTLAVDARCKSMKDLNSASLADISAAGFDPVLAREVGFWRPYQTWDQLLLVGGVDEAALERLQRRGFEIGSPNQDALTPPKPFRLSVSAR
ncbi:MAG: hypothetical protein B7Y81_12685 [Caulobacter sp. 32-67-35]|nr:MAG: hypothetical protein B7Y81_12685 [Caulobacter sp. 32-67-35]